MPCCPGCAQHTTAGEYCGSCLQHPQPFSRVHTLYSYQFPVDRLVGGVKFRQQLPLANWLAQAFYQHNPALGAQLDLLVPMPLHPRRLRERGFNQAALLANELSRLYQLPVDANACTRLRDTPQQAKLDLKARERNVKQAFGCHADVSGLRIGIVDDVITTGSTAASLSRTLLEAGASRVEVLTLACTPKD